MSTQDKTKAARITQADIQSIAQAGVRRALATRATVGEMTADEIAAVSGGALSLATTALTRPILTIRPGNLAGPFPVDVATLGSIAKY